MCTVNLMLTTIKLENGRNFPVYEGLALSWDIASYNSLEEERLGYPRMRAVIRAMREHRPEQLERERREMLKASLSDRMFGHNAKKVLAVIEVECEFPAESSMGPTEGEL